jgi:hypothetical protein
VVDILLEEFFYIFAAGLILPCHSGIEMGNGDRTYWQFVQGGRGQFVLLCMLSISIYSVW